MGEKIKEEFESKIYIMYEMRDELESTIAQINTVLHQQEKLIKIVTGVNEETTKEFSEFTKGLIESINQTKEQQSKLKDKLVHINAILQVYEKKDGEENSNISKTVDLIVTYTINALGL